MKSIKPSKFQSLFPTIVFIGFIIMAFFAFRSGCRKHPSGISYKIKMERLGLIHKNIGPPTVSTTGSHIAYRLHKGNKACMVVDGQAGPEYE